MGLFSKKICDICGGEIGLLGNKKLEDGNLCKNCAAKLSPFMTDRRESTVKEIAEHLAYREENRKKLPTLQISRVLGHNTKVYIDDAQGVFFVTSRSNWQEENPDIISLSQVISCNVEAKDHPREVYRKDPQGRNISYDPPRYEHSYSFDVAIDVNSPYFSRIWFELTATRPKDMRSPEYRAYAQEAEELMASLQPGAAQQAQPDLADVLSAVVSKAKAALDPNSWTCACGTVNTGNFCVQCGQKKPEPEAEQPAEEDGSWTCACGTVNTGNFCTECGRKKPEPKAEPVCSQCGWKPEGDAPKFCPQCGTPFAKE